MELEFLSLFHFFFLPKIAIGYLEMFQIIVAILHLVLYLLSFSIVFTFNW